MSCLNMYQEFCFSSTVSRVVLSDLKLWVLYVRCRIIFFLFLPLRRGASIPSEPSWRGSTGLDEPTDSRSLGSRDGVDTCTTAIEDLPADVLATQRAPTAKGSQSTI
jgi:hypothetical protein